jgi:hypothetical protein
MKDWIDPMLMTAPLVSQMRQERRGHVVGAVEVDRERRVPIGARARVVDLAAADDAGVVDEDGHGADLAPDHAGKIVASGAVGDVAGMVRGVRADRLGGALGRKPVDVDRDDARARLGHGLGDAFADAGTGAGHERYAACQQGVHVPLTSPRD